MHSEKQILERLVTEVAVAARLPAEQIDVREPFASYDIGSIEAVHIVGVLEVWLGVELDATLLWDHSTIESLARHLAGILSPRASAAGAKPGPKGSPARGEGGL